MIFYLFWDQKFTQKFNIPIGMLCPYFPLSEKLLLFTGFLLLSVVLGTTAELVRNADSQVPPGPTESKPASWQDPQKIHVHIQVTKGHITSFRRSILLH